jgi:hypothetical protein
MAASFVGHRSSSSREKLARGFSTYGIEGSPL